MENKEYEEYLKEYESYGTHNNGLTEAKIKEINEKKNVKPIKEIRKKKENYNGIRYKLVEAILNRIAAVVGALIIGLLIGVLIIGLVKMSGRVDRTATDIAERGVNEFNENVAATYDRDTLHEGILIYKGFWERGIFTTRRVNYFTLMVGGKELELRVPLEVYRDYREGDAIRLYNDAESGYVVLEDNKVLIKMD